MRAQSLLGTLTLLGVATAAPAQHRRTTANEARQIAAQPARDVGIGKTKVPPVLQRAAAAPYATSGTADCAQIDAAVGELDEALGPDFGQATTPRGSRVGTAAKVGGAAVVNSIIPLRGVVREVSGAAAADRRMAAAIDAGFARRGFLRGLAAARNCPIQ